MGNELEPITGTVLDESPIISVEEAEAVMAHAMLLLRQGQDLHTQAQVLLQMAERRQVWKALGFSTWEDCLATGLSATFNITVATARRLPLVIAMRQQGLGTGEIADSLGVNPSTVTRDLMKARDAGMLDDEPGKVTGADGRARATTRGSDPPASPLGTRRPRRPDLYRSWRMQIEFLERASRKLNDMRDDNRYPDRLQDLALGSRADIERAHGLLTQILEDFSIVTTDGMN